MTRPQVERPMTREELMAMREVARKAWAAARGYHNEVMGTENAAFDAWADHHFPLPAPEPQQATGRSGTVYLYRHHCLVRGDNSLGCQSFPVDPVDRATVANLLCPIEDVVRATLEEAGIYGFEKNDPGLWMSRSDLMADMPKYIPAILKRLSR